MPQQDTNIPFSNSPGIDTPAQHWMLTARNLITCLFIGLTITVPLKANKAPPQNVKLDSPLIAKAGWKTQSMQSADINNDGKTDLLLINNEDGKIDILLQQSQGQKPQSVTRQFAHNRWEPIVENAPFIKEKVTTAVSMYALRTGDLNKDGLEDIVFTSKAKALSVLFQLKEGGFSDAKTYENFKPVAWTSSLVVKDINNDDVDDIVVLGKERILLFTGGVNESLSQPQIIRIINDVAYGLEVTDLNNDGLPDLLYLLGNSERMLRTRLQEKDGKFGPEQSHPIQTGKDVVQVLNEDTSHPLLIHLDKNTSAIQTFQIKESIARNNSDEVYPQIYTSGTSNVSPARYTIGDFTGDGLLDVIAGDSAEALVRLFPGRGKGAFSAAIEYPSLAKLDSIHSAKDKSLATPALVLFSQSENIIGISYFEDNRLSFPQPLSADGDIKTITVADLNNDGNDELISIAKKDKQHLVTLSNITGETTHHQFEIKDALRSPRSIWVQDFDRDGNKDILILFPRESARLYHNKINEDNTWAYEEIAVLSSVRKSLLHDLNLSQLGLGDINGDGNNELLIMGSGYARSVVLNEKHELEIIDQYNAKNRQDQVSLPFTHDIDGDKKNEIFFYHKSENQFQVIKQRDDGVYRFSHTIDVGEINPISTATIDDALLIFGKQRFWSLAFNDKEESNWHTEVISQYETDFDDVVYNAMAIGDLNADETNEIIVLDGQKHLLETLSWEKGQGWKSRLHFTVFEANRFYRGRKGSGLEPREMLIDDFNNDGLNDLVLLVHDRILLYPQIPLR